MKVLGKFKCMVLAACVCMAAAVGIGCAGCASTDADRAAVKAEVAAVMRLAYDAGAKDAVAKRIDQLAADGKITDEQAEVLHRAAQAAYEHALVRLEGTNAAPSTAARPAPADAASAPATNCTDGVCAPTNCVDGACTYTTNCVDGACTPTPVVK